MLTLCATANHVIALQYLCMCLMSQMFLFHLIFYGGAGAPASPSLAPPMNEEMAKQNHHLHLCDTDTENTSLLVKKLNISLLFPPDTFMVITFAGALWQALLRVFEAELFSCADGSLCCCGTLNTVEPLLTVATRSPVVSTSAAIFFITNWWMSKI